MSTQWRSRTCKSNLSLTCVNRQLHDSLICPWPLSTDSYVTVWSVPDLNRQLRDSLISRSLGPVNLICPWTVSTDSYITVPGDLEPTAEDLSQGFSISAWVQPSPLCNGYIVARSRTDGTSHYYSLRLIATATSTTLDMTISSDSSLVSCCFGWRLVHEGLGREKGTC